MSGIGGRVVRRMVLQRRVQRLNWAQLCSGAEAERERFEGVINGIPASAVHVHGPGLMSVCATLAHLAVANVGITGRLEEIRHSREGAAPPDLFPDTSELAYTDTVAQYKLSWTALEQQFATPITTAQTLDHPFFGPMTGPEWVALVAVHHEYHLRRIERLIRCRDYIEAAGPNWSAK